MAVLETPASGPRRKGPFYTELYFQVLAAILIGGFIGHFYRGEPWIAEYLKPLGDAFVKLVKMIIAPVIFLTIVIGIAGMRDMGRLGRVVFRAFAYFLFFSTLALVVGLIVGNVVQPGAGMNIDIATLAAGDVTRVQGFQAASQDYTLVSFLLNIIPETFVGAFTSGNILQVLFLSIVVGVAMALVGDRAEPALIVLSSVAAVIFRVVGILMRAAPLGAFGAFAFVVSSQGLEAIQNLAILILSVYVTSILFIVIVLGAVAAWAGFNIVKLIRYLKEELFLVLGTSSSESALPALMEKMERAGCARPIVGLVVPTGYSFNLDGTNIYMTLAALFIAQATNTPLGLDQQIILLLVAMLSSKGAAGVTGAGFITLAATLAVFPSIPIEGMAIILGVDRFLSECRALTNFIGNAVATVVVSRWEGALDKDKLKSALNGEPAPLAAQPIEQDAD
jgi:aerobic C4-dicarboxylate transport protein